MLPLCRELHLTAPLHGLFPIFLSDAYPVFLDSSMPHPRLGRYSYLSAEPFLVLRSKDGCTEVERRGELLQLQGDPFEHLRFLLSRYPAGRLPAMPPFQGGAIGYFAYDLAHHVERLPRTTVDDLGMPDLAVGFYDWVLAQDHVDGRTWLMASPHPDGDYGRAAARLEEVGAKCEVRSAESPSLAPRTSHFAPDFSNETERCPGPSLSSTFAREGYVEAVRRAKGYIAAGDIYQVCLSQRIEFPAPPSPWELYMRLREISPVPYAAYLGLGDAAIVSASPERFLRKEGRRVETRPIKGTRPRGTTPEEDRRLAAELLASEKDRAENVMIVDLLRNDLGRACRVGTVRVSKLFGVESYSTVHHLVSTVEGVLEEGQDAVSLLRGCFPGGSVTGCPKIRAMEIIDELEPTQRGVYCGSIGYVGFDGEMDTSIVIRTVVVKDGRAYLQVGGAVVADSDPEEEYQETLDKARAAILALEGVERCAVA